MRLPPPIPVFAALLVTLGSIAPARAESWCAYPLWAHEWGVNVFGSDGLPARGPDLPSWFHTTAARAPAGDGRAAPPPNVRDLPVDSGIRTLPVIQFYSVGSLSSPIPVGIEVGFRHGPAAVWYPQIDLLRTEAAANSPEALARRGLLLAQRAARAGFFVERPPLPPDPTRQLIWNHLSLSRAQERAPAKSDTPWVDALRAIDGAMWVRGAESERFVFYEAKTDERMPLVLARAPDWRPDARRYTLENRGRHPVHDVVLVHREDESGAPPVVVDVSTLAAGDRVAFDLDAHAIADAAAFEAATYGALRDTLVDRALPSPPKDYRWGGDAGCVALRDPAIPVEKAEGHRLFAAEVDVILAVWGDRFFEQPGTTIVFREDLASLEEAMPLSLYTDMYNFILLRRAGLALWQSPTLP